MRGRWACWLVCVCICVFVYIYMCVSVYVYIYKLTWTCRYCAPKCSEDLVRGSCNHFAVKADKGPCVVDGIGGLSVCVFIYIYIYV
jgi:hypothetical protein